MKKDTIITILLFLILSNINLFSVDCSLTEGSSIDSIFSEKIISTYENNQIISNLKSYMGYFTENQGQIRNDDVHFYEQDGSMWFTNDGVWFNIYEEEIRDREYINAFNPIIIQEHKPNSRCGVILKQEFVDCNPVTPEGVEYAGWNSNFFYGNDSIRWRTNVPNFREVWYKGLWDGIDLRYYTNTNGLKYDFIVNPGADISQIKMRWKGAQGLEVDKQGNLIIKTAIGNMVDSDLFVYQDYFGERYQVNGGIRIIDNIQYSFKIMDNYYHDEVLIIDPSLDFSSYLGGLVEDCVQSMTVDFIGNPIVTGRTNSFNFPTTPGAYNLTNLNEDIFVTKFNLDGSSLVFSTFIGGTGYDWSWSINLDSSGNSCVTGYTSSVDFPTTLGANDTSYNGGFEDGYVFKLNTNGSALIFSSYIGGDGTDGGFAIVVDSLGNIYITGTTQSSNFPITSGAFDTILNGSSDIFISKLNSNASSLLYSTFIGGSESESSNDISIDSSGHVIVIGITNSSDFLIVPGAFDSTFNGGCDVFFIELNISGSTLFYSTFLGGSEDDFSGGVVLDNMGNVYLSGWTESSDFPTTLGAHDTSFNGGSDGYFLKLNTSSSSLLYSTLIGGSGEDGSYRFVLDSFYNVIFLGRTSSLDFPTTAYAYDTTFNGGTSDGFLSKLDPSGSTLLYSTFIGGSGWDSLNSIGTGPFENVYISGFTDSQDFPTTQGSYDQSNNGGNWDAIVMKFLFETPRFCNITSLSCLKESSSTSIAYSRYGSYTLRVNISDTFSLTDLETVTLTIDPLGKNIQLIWNQFSNQFFELSDPQNYVSLEPTSFAYNDDIFNWTVDFNLTINWNYPDESFNDVSAHAVSISLPSTWYNTTNLFTVENDLEFIGDLSVISEDNRILSSGGLVRGGENLNWSGFIPVYQNTNNVFPPEEEFDITIWDEDGNHWFCSPLPGERFEIGITTSSTSNIDGNIHRINISGIPPECDLTNVTFMLRIDGDNISFSNPTPLSSLWQTKSDVDVGVTITDSGGGIVNGESIMIATSIDNGSTWESWHELSDYKSYIYLTPIANVKLREGKNNLVKWSAKDTVGNGPTVSPAYRVWVDTEEVMFSDFFQGENRTSTPGISLGVKISDNTSGVNGSRIDYAISTNDGKTWEDWTSISECDDGPSIDVHLDLMFPEGNSSRIKFRAWDVAGNGPIVSEFYPIEEDISVPVEVPRVALIAPSNNSVIGSTTVELSWELEDDIFDNVKYDVYIDTTNPPEEKVIQNHSDRIFTVTGLVDDMTYYWTIIPFSDEANIGICKNGVWSFSVELPEDITPTVEFGLRLGQIENITVNRGNSTSVTGYLTNLGSSVDTFGLGVETKLVDQILINASKGITVGVNGSNEFILFLTIIDSTVPGDYPVTITAWSLGAEMAGLNASDNVTFVVHIIDLEPHLDQKEKTEGKADLDWKWIVLIAIGILILIVMMVTRKMRKPDIKKKEEDEERSKKEPTRPIGGKNVQRLPLATPLVVPGTAVAQQPVVIPTSATPVSPPKSQSIVNGTLAGTKNMSPDPRSPTVGGAGMALRMQGTQAANESDTQMSDAPHQQVPWQTQVQQPFSQVPISQQKSPQQGMQQ